MNQCSKAVQKIFTKKAIYFLCFVALNLIELLKASQSGAVWYVAVNCTGLVVMILVVSGWPLRDFCTPGNGIYTILCAAAMIVVGVWWQPTGQCVLWQIETAILNVWWIGIVVKRLFYRIVIEKTISVHMTPMKWLWVLMTLLMTFSVSRKIWPLWFFLMFGAFYLTEYKEEDRAALWDAMIDGTIFSFFCIQIYAYGFRPYDELRYKGAFANSNMAGLYYLIIYMMCLYKLHLLELRETKKGWKLFYLIGAGGMLSFQIFTMCRTAWITSLFLTVLYGVSVIRKKWKKTWGQVLLRGTALGVATVLTFLPVFYSIRRLPTILHHPIWYEGEYSIGKVHSFDPPDSEKYTELDEFLNALFNRIIRTFINAGKGDPLALKAYAMETDNMERVELVEMEGLDDALRVRLTIYKAYIEDLTLYGHGPQDGFYLLGEGDYHSWHAQNLWLQIAYTYGIPTGVLLVILTCVMLRTHKRRMDKSENPYAIIPFFTCAAAFLFGLTEIVWGPGQLIMFLFFFVQHPQMGKTSKAEDAREGMV